MMAASSNCGRSCVCAPIAGADHRQPGFNRWLVPPAALAIHLCIGMSYGLSVFWLPLAQAIGISKPAPAQR